MTISYALKRLPFTHHVNAALKSRQMRVRYERTIRRYSNGAEIATGEGSIARASAVSALWSSNSMGVFLLGTDEQQDKSGFLQALQAKADVRCFTRDDGAWGQNDPSPYAQRLRRNTARLEALFASHAADGWIPHVLIGQTWGCLIEPACFTRLRERYGVFVINISMDDRHQYWGNKVNGQWDGTYPLIPHIDLTLTAAPEAVHWYRCEGGAALYFPEASDPAIFAPRSDLPKSHDVAFVGSRYGIRQHVVEALRKAGVNVAAYGSGWEAGRLATEAVPTLFAQSRIVLGVSAIGHSRDFVGLKLRDFDAPLSGSCYLTQYNPDLESLYAIGTEMVTYRDIRDCVAQVQSLLADPARLAAIGAAGHARALAEHTWSKRLDDMFAALPGHP